MPNGKHICRVDGKTFPTARALAQHTRDLHSAAVPKPAPKSKRMARPKKQAPRSRVGTTALGPSASHRIVSGADILGTFSVNSAQKAGTTVAGGTLVPTFWDETRINAESLLWSRWRPKALTIEIVSSAGAMTSGSFVAGWTMDPDLWLENDVSSIREVASMRPSMQCHISKGLRMKIPCDTSRKWYALDEKADLVDRAHGKWLLVLSAPVGNITAASQFTFTVRLRYTIEFDTPMLALKLAQPAKQKTVYANAGFESYFTDSDGGVENGKICLLKKTAGGTLCEFDNLVDNAYYVIDSSARLNYWPNADKTDEKVIKYAVKYHGHTKHLAMVASEQYAKLYVANHNSKYLLPYYATGDVVTPSNPAWFEIPVDGKRSVSDKIASLELKIERLMLALTSQASTSAIAIADETSEATTSRANLNKITEVLSDCSEDKAGIGVFNTVLIPLARKNSLGSEASGSSFAEM